MAIFSEEQDESQLLRNSVLPQVASWGKGMAYHHARFSNELHNMMVTTLTTYSKAWLGMKSCGF